MAERDGSLKKYSASWLANKKLWQSSEVWELFRSVYISQRKGRFSLSTQLARYKLQQLHFKLQGQSQKAERARQRWQAIHSFYKEFPEMWYLLDNTYYTHYLGLFAMGLF